MKRGDRLVDQPHLIFLIDGIGAMGTALSLLILLPNLSIFQMPADILYFLGSIAVVFAFYSLSHYFAKTPNTQYSIRTIAIGNLIYILTTWSILLLISNELSSFDYLYFIGEMVIVLVLIRIEWKITRTS